MEGEDDLSRMSTNEGRHLASGTLYYFPTFVSLVELLFSLATNAFI